MTTYIINGNSIPSQISLDEMLRVDNDEKFIIVTNDNCAKTTLATIEKLCHTNNVFQHRRIKANKKKWFASDVKCTYKNYLNDPDDRVVVMPSTTIAGEDIERDIKAGKVSIVSGYKSYKENGLSTTRAFDWNKTPVSEIEAGGRMHILIDYENVSHAGLEGASYLTKDDYVTVFYSHSCENIQKGYFDAIIENAGSFDIVKLTEIRKNGLDFYIAIRVGEILQKYPGEKIMIVSQDQGYYAILDYCSAYASIEGKIKFAASIEVGITMLDGETYRRNRIMERRKTTSLEMQYEKYQEKRILYEQISELFADTPYADEIDRIFGLVESKDTPRKLYTASMHEFGAKRGRAIYRLIKMGA